MRMSPKSGRSTCGARVRVTRGAGSWNTVFENPPAIHPATGEEASPMHDPLVLTVDGNVARPLRLSLADLDALPESARVRDVSRFHPTRQGDGVTLESILESAGVQPGANYLTLHADRDDFHVSVPLREVRDQGIVVYRLGQAELGPDHGGPFRFLI